MKMAGLQGHAWMINFRLIEELSQISNGDWMEGRLRGEGVNNFSTLFRSSTAKDMIHTGTIS